MTINACPGGKDLQSCSPSRSARGLAICSSCHKIIGHHSPAFALSDQYSEPFNHNDNSPGPSLAGVSRSSAEWLPLFRENSQRGSSVEAAAYWKWEDNCVKRGCSWLKWSFMYLVTNQPAGHCTDSTQHQPSTISLTSVYFQGAFTKNLWIANAVCSSFLTWIDVSLLSKHIFSTILPGFVHHHLSFVWLETLNLQHTHELPCFGLIPNATDCAISSGSVWTYCRGAGTNCNDGLCERNVKLILWGGWEGYSSSFEEGLSSESVWREKTVPPLETTREFLACCSSWVEGQHENGCAYRRSLKIGEVVFVTALCQCVKGFFVWGCSPCSWAWSLAVLLPLPKAERWANASHPL